MKVLTEDLSNKERMPNNLNNYLAENEYYYVSNYPCSYFNNSNLGTDHWNISLKDVNKVINLDYTLISSKNAKLQRFVGNIVDVVQSVDRFGVKAAICLNQPTNAHPGNKRLIVSRYLGKSTVPVIGKREFFKDDTLQMSRLDTIDDLYDVFGTEISVVITPKNFLEVFYHGESLMRDANGMDNFAKKAYLVREQNKLCPSISDYLLKNGLEIVCGFDKVKKTKKIYKAFYSKTPVNKIYVEILDDTILENKFSYWDLFFHFDYENHVKICKTKKLKLVNNLSIKNNIVENCSLYDTLTRQKNYL